MAVVAVEALGLGKRFGDRTAVSGIDLAVEAGTIFGVLGPNGAGKTTTLRMLLGIIDPDEGRVRLFGNAPAAVADRVGYMPEERGLYPAMPAAEAIAFVGALRGLSLREARARAKALLADHGLPPDRPVRRLSKGQAQTVQLLATIVHRPRLIVLDEPFSGLDAINQARLEETIRAEAAGGATILFSTHVIAHAERLCERIAVIAAGRVRFAGTVAEARATLRPQVRLAVSGGNGDWRAGLPGGAAEDGGVWRFALPDAGIEPLLAALLAAGARIETLSIERPGLHDAFVAMVGAAA